MRPPVLSVKTCLPLSAGPGRLLSPTPPPRATLGTGQTGNQKRDSDPGDTESLLPTKVARAGAKLGWGELGTGGVRLLLNKCSR